MPITHVKAFATEDGQTFDTIEKAQEHELEIVFGDVPRDDVSTARVVLNNKERVLAILSATGRKPRTRKAGKKAKTPTAETGGGK